MAIDLVRICVVALVIATHIMATGPLYDSVTSGFVWMISHTSRNLFILMTALVLTYSYAHRALNVWSFYKKRFTLILLPYITWTLIYQVRWGIQQHTIGSFLGVFWNNFITANAMYHLYFLLITMQIYLIFPLIRYIYQKIKTHPVIIFLISLGFQLALTAVMQYGPHPSWLGWYFDHPDNYLIEYQLYIVMGILIATHLQAFENFVLAHAKKIAFTSVGVVILGQFAYAVQVVMGSVPHVAAAVYQPFITIEAVAVCAGLFALGFTWNARGARLKSLVSTVAENSFGIYLSHVLFLTYLVHIQPADNTVGTALLELLLGLPLVYILAFSFTEIFRHTWVSVLLTGRHQSREWQWRPGWMKRRSDAPIV